MSTTNEQAPASAGWKIVKTHVSGAFHYEEAKAPIADPWQLPKVKAQALRLALLGWQIAGGSQSEPPPGWRTFLLEEMEQVAFGTEKFASRPDYRPEKIAFAEIIAEVTP